MLYIKSADYIEKYIIKTVFSDDKIGFIDLKDFIFSTQLKNFHKLQDINIFKDFKINYTIIWSDDLDLAPEYLYFLAFQNELKLQNKFQKWGYIK